MADAQSSTGQSFSRRMFIGYTAGAAAVVAYGDKLHPKPDQTRPGQLGPMSLDAASHTLGGTPDFGVLVRRAADQCVLTIAFWNCSPTFTSTPSTFQAGDTSKPSYMTVTPGMVGRYLDSRLNKFDSLAPQNIIETSFPIVSAGLDKGKHSEQLGNPGKSIRPTSTAPLAKPGTVGASPAGPSTLAFIIPADMLGANAIEPLLMDTDSLLTWTGLHLSVVPQAVPPLTLVTQAPKVTYKTAKAPSPTQTSIEMPFNLVISPPEVASPFFTNGPAITPYNVFVNATDPVIAGEWTEIWHTRMAAAHSVFEAGSSTNAESAKEKKDKRHTSAKPDAIVGHYVTVIDETTRDLMTVRAVWCLDKGFTSKYRANATEPPGDVPGSTDIVHPSLRFADRFDIVRLSSDFTPAKSGGPLDRVAQGLPAFIPSPATVDRLMLSSLGGWLQADGHWDLPFARGADYNSSLLSWRHRAAQGRDSYVRVVRKGYLFPWGHKASLITITERQVDDYKGHPGAYMRQKTYIVVANPIMTYGGSGDFAPHKGTAIPFTSVEAVTLITPPIAETNSYTTKQGAKKEELCFQPTLADGSPYRFHMRGTDWAGALIDFHSPVVWFDDTVSYGNGSKNTKIRNEAIKNWNNPKPPSIPLNGQRVSLATPTNVGDTQFVVSSFQVMAAKPTPGTSSQHLIDASHPAFYPQMGTVTVSHPELGTAAGEKVPGSVFTYNASYYLKFGFGSKNAGELFLSSAAAAGASALKFKSDHSGGSITPNISIDHISRAIGPVSGSETRVSGGHFDPQKVFADSGANAAKLLGGITLGSIVKQANFGNAQDAQNSETLTITTAEIASPHHIRTVVDWHPQIQTGGPTGADDLFQPFQNGDPTDTSDDPVPDAMDLHAVIITSLDASMASTTSVVGQIREFNLNLFGTGSTYFILIPFDSLTFHSQSGQKTDVQVQVNSGGIQFKGPLGFVQDLASYLSFDGSGITINTAGPAITADLTLAIPNITVGIFALDNIAFSAGVAIPYNGDPVSFNFAFCSVENPFQLEILIFTGGGYVSLTIGAHGLQELSIGFDFGFGYSIDIGIASGQVSLTGGITYTSQQLAIGQDVTLTAYIQAGGGLSCLGVVSVSVQLYLGLKYHSVDGQSSLSGTATLTISVHVLFFGFDVGISMSETFAGHDDGGTSGAHLRHRAHLAKLNAARAKAIAAKSDVVPDFVPDPTEPNTFGGTMTSDDWAAYCTSFAVVTAV
jgi:hypothetical protein